MACTLAGKDSPSSAKLLTAQVGSFRPQQVQARHHKWLLMTKCKKQTSTHDYTSGPAKQDPRIGMSYLPPSPSPPLKTPQTPS